MSQMDDSARRSVIGASIAVMLTIAVGSGGSLLFHPESRTGVQFLVLALGCPLAGCVGALMGKVFHKTRNLDEASQEDAR